MDTVQLVAIEADTNSGAALWLAHLSLYTSMSRHEQHEVARAMSSVTSPLLIIEDPNFEYALLMFIRQISISELRPPDL